MKTIKPHGKYTILLSFVEEFWRGQTVKSMGRVEVSRPKDQYPSEEIRFGTNSPDWYDFRERWDFRYVTADQLEFIRREIADKYCKKLQETPIKKE